MRTSVVVVSLQPGDWLEECLRSVTAEADEVVLVDNGSADATASIVGRRMGVTVVRSRVNLGFAGGVNLGVRHASGDVVALLNDDASAHPGWLARAADALAAPDVAAVTPKVLHSGLYVAVTLADEPWQAPGDERILGRRVERVEADGVDVLARVAGPGVYHLEVDEAGNRWRWSRPGQPVYVPVPHPGAEVCIDGEQFTGPVCRLVNKAGTYLAVDGILGDVGDNEPDDGRFDEPGEQFFASGTALAMRAETFARVGDLAEPLFAYFEDADWSWRARLGGLRIVYDPRAVVDHRQSATSGGWSTQWVRRWVPANHAACLLRNAPLPHAYQAIRRHLEEVRHDQARLALLSRIPWALRGRPGLSRTWALDPTEVWDRWAGVGAPTGV
ncbi:MAG: glycosyltransferase family 2 protein [Actinomycetota bacterium]|nr:glycosyltransferase family 2 protein [Actinomycetota bacterium]